MMQLTKCWVCGRSGEEIKAALVEGDQEGSELDKEFSQVAWFRSKFNESATAWRRAVPKDFREMDFGFVTGNPDQFGAVTFIGEVNDARSVMMDWLSRASVAISKGDEGALQNLNLTSLGNGDRETLARSFELFESHWHRLLAKEEAENGKANYPTGFDGLGLADGVEYLISAGLLYYDAQNMLIQFKKNAETAKRPKFGIRVVQSKFGPVPLCDVCAGLVVGLRSAETEVVEQPEVGIVREPHKRVRQPEVVAPVIARPAAKQAQAQTSEDESSLKASPGYLDIVRKLGPSSEEMGPRPTYLHDHRMKEAWDDILEQRATASMS